MNEQGSMMGQWVSPSPTSKAFFSSYLGGDEQINSGQTQHIRGEIIDGDSSFVTHQGMCFEDNKAKEETVSYGSVKSGSRGGLGDRLAARAGFNAPRLDTGSIRSNDLPFTDETKSHYLTIPPGISPTALLESPIFVSNSLTQASPTTGKFPLFQDGKVRGFTMAANGQSKDDFFDDVDGSSFAFKPHLEPGLPFALDTSNKMGQAMNPQFFPNIEVPAKSENTFQDFILSHIGSNEGLSQSPNEKDHMERKAGSDVKGLYTINGTAEHSPPLSDQQDDEGDQRVVVDPMALGNAGSQPEDGYNWRKYGQKTVKGSEYPRSYYKCTQVNCPVKKKVERSEEGHVTEIIYNGAHNHPKPALNRRSGFNQMDDTHVLENGLPREWRSDSFEYTSLNSMNSEQCNPLQNGAVIESGDAVDPSCTFSNDEDEDDRRTHGSVSIAKDGDGDGDESESKRRRLETYAAEMGSGATRAIREPRVVVQTVSDVDILEDGYRWRKYGQKVVKGNPNPRSYYKCTSVGCTVRKHVERASHDLKSVITTYEGKHNHEVPPARNSSHLNSATSSAFTSQSQSLIPRSEQSQITSMARHERQLNLGSFNMSMMPPLRPPLNQPTFANFSVAGLGAGMRVNPYLMQQQQQQQQQVNDMGFMMPRGEAKVEPNLDPSVYLSNGSSVYHQIMNRLPLGP